MLKKIALVMLLALPMGVFAQNLKFGHINAQEIITVMPEFTKAQNDIQTLEKQLTAELQRTQEEFNKKYQEFQQAMAKDSLPANIAERRQKELQDMMQRQEQFQQDAQQQMQKAQTDAMAPIYKCTALQKAKIEAPYHDLTRDHLDYHKTFENYRNAKKDRRRMQVCCTTTCWVAVFC